MCQSKIFGIGLSRTGTTSLTEALEILESVQEVYEGLQSFRDIKRIDAR
jgi:hypothetical protein